MSAQAGEAGQAGTAGPAARGHHVRIEGGADFLLGADEDSLLRGALRAGIGFPHECSVGGCGACRFELLDGLVQSLWEQAPGLSEREKKRGKRLACQTRVLGDCTIKLRCDEAYRPAVPPRRRRARLVARHALTHDMAHFSFRSEGPAEFLPGQYALLQFSGVAGLRAYSMDNLPNEQGQWDFIVRRTPAGAGTAALFDQVQLHDTLLLDGPYGHAYWRPGCQRPIVCIAGGSGLAPMLSVASAALAAPGGPPVHFFLGLRNEADLGAAAPVDRLARTAPARCQAQVVLSNPEPGGAWSGPVGFVHTVLTPALPAALESFEYYLAGPAPMVEAVQALLAVQHRVPHAQIHFDRFV